MKFHPTSLPGAFVIEQTPFTDERGWFARAFCEKELASAGISERFVQMNMSGNVSKGTIRGLHFQSAAAPEAKLLRCVRGAVYDVIVDMRPDAATFGNWFGIELTMENRLAIYAPPLFAHGYVSLVDDTEVLYQTSAFYTPGVERGVRFDDPGIGITWPCEILEVTQKDRSWPDVNMKERGR